MNFMPFRQVEAALAQRAVGRLALGFRHGPPRGTRIETFYQQGCLKARLPRPLELGVCEAVTLNISGGVAGGDRLETSITLGAGARVVLASQAAERIYRALEEPAWITTRIALDAGAKLDYLPQATIFFDGFRLNRSLEISLAADAEFLGLESLVFGRQAMGEAVRDGWLRDRITLRRGGEVLLQDMTRLEGDIAAILHRPGVAAGAIAVATIIYAAPDAPDKLPHVRAALGGRQAGASLMDGILRARILAPDAAALQSCVVAVLNTCRDGAALPRVWQG